MKTKKLFILVCIMALLAVGCSNKKEDALLKQNEDLQKQVEQLQNHQTSNNNTNVTSNNTPDNTQPSTSQQTNVDSQDNNFRHAEEKLTALINPSYQLIPSDKADIELINGVKYYIFYEEYKASQSESDYRYCIAVDSGKIYRQLATGEMKPFNGSDITHNQDSAQQQADNNLSQTGLNFSNYKFVTYNKSTSFYMLRAEFKITNTTSEIINLYTTDFVLRQAGGNAVEPNQNGGGYSYSNSGYVTYKLEPISLKPGDTCDASFDFNLNDNQDAVFTLYYSKNKQLIPLTNISSK